MKDILMVHIPKTSGVTTKTILMTYPRFNNDLIVSNAYFSHNYASFIKKTLGDSYDDFFKFTIVRNPWDRLWSGYKFLKFGSDVRPPKLNELGGRTFEQYIDHIYATKLYTLDKSRSVGSELLTHQQSNWVYDNGNLIVDHVARFEDLGSLYHLLQTNQQLDGIYDKFKKMHKNKSTNRDHYTVMYNDRMIELVGEMYERDIKNFNYSYE